MTETSRTHPSLALHNGGGRCLGGDVCAAGCTPARRRRPPLAAATPRPATTPAPMGTRQGRGRGTCRGHVVDAPRPARQRRRLPHRPNLARARLHLGHRLRLGAGSGALGLRQPRPRLLQLRLQRSSPLRRRRRIRRPLGGDLLRRAARTGQLLLERSDAAACGLHVPHRHRHQVRRGGLRLLRRLQLLAGRRTCLLQRVNLRLRTCLGHVVDVSCTCLLQRTNLRLRHADRFGVRRRRRRRSLLGTAPLLGELLLSSGAGGLRGKAPAGRLREGSEKAPRRLRHALWPASLPASLR